MNRSSRRRHDPLRAVPDLAGIPAVDSGGFPIGAVYGALIEADCGLLRYLDVALDEDGRHILVPIGHTKLQRDEESARVRLRAATLEDLRTIPAFEPHAAPPGDEFQDEILTLHGRIFYGQRYYAHPCFDHQGLYAGDHPILRGPQVPLEGDEAVHALSTMEDFRVAPDEPDIRGWEIVDAEGERLGEVRELLISPEAEKVRYGIVLREDGSEADGVLIALPVGYLAIDPDAQRVRTPALDLEDLGRLPVYDAAHFDRAAEERLRDALESILSGDRRFDRPDFAAGASDERVGEAGRRLPGVE